MVRKDLPNDIVDTKVPYLVHDVSNSIVRKTRIRTIIILVDERDPILHERTKHVQQRHTCGRVRERLQLGACPCLPDGPAQEVPEHVSVTLRVLGPLEGGRRRGDAPEVPGQELQGKGTQDGPISVFASRR